MYGRYANYANVGNIGLIKLTSNDFIGEEYRYKKQRQVKTICI